MTFFIYRDVSVPGVIFCDLTSVQRILKTILEEEPTGLKKEIIGICISTT